MLVMTLQCGGANGAECFAGITRMADESHEAARATWSSIIAEAEASGWCRDPVAGRYRCPACAAAGENVFGIAIAIWRQALELYCSGVKLRDFAGINGMPTRMQFWNAVSKRPEWHQRIKAAGVVRRAGPIAAETWPKVVARIDAGEALTAICTGRDGWPSMRQWRDYAAEHPDIRAKADAFITARKAERAATARAARRPREGKRVATDAAAQLIRAKRRAERAAEAEARRAERAAAAEARRARSEAKRKAAEAERARLALIRDLAREADRRRKAEAAELAKQARAAARLIERQRQAAESAAERKARAVAGDLQFVPIERKRRPHIIRDGPRRAPRPVPAAKVAKVKPEPKRADPAGVTEALRLVAARCHVSRRAILSAGRSAKLVNARHIWRYLVAVEMDAGAIGANRAGLGDVSSVARSCAIIEDRRDDDSKFDQWLIDASRAIAAAMGAKNGEHSEPANAIAGNATVAKGCDA